MVNDPKRPIFSPFQERAELDLLHVILQGVDNPAYSWNPADPHSEVLFEHLEQEVAALDWADEDYAPYVQTLSAQMDAVWAELRPTPVLQANISPFKPEVLQRLVAQVPSHFVDSIVHRAQQAIAHNRSMAEQMAEHMVACVQDLLPHLGVEDLLVFARPLAYTMRDSDVLDNTLQSIPEVAWEELSDLEQARLSLAIARCALAQSPTPSAE